jgi:CheY-like chemotaxis protein
VPTKILVADDSATMRRVLEMTFAGEDATVTTVEAAEAALAKAGELSPDLIFADASLPGVDGYELAKRIKADPKLAKIAVVLMASQQAPYDDAKGRAAGVDDHISKPFDTQSVIDRVGQVLAKARSAPAAEAKPAAAPPARPAPPAPVAPVAAAASAPAAARPPQGTRMGVGAVPLQPAAKPGVAAPQPMPALRQGGAPPSPIAAPAAAAKPVAPPPAARPAAAAPVVGAVAAAAVSQDLSSKLSALGLTREQVEGVLALSREVVEQVVWEVVPELAETIIKEELKRLTAD